MQTDCWCFLGYAPYVFVANFVYFRVNGAADVARALLERGVFVRSLHGFGDSECVTGDRRD